MKHVDVNGVRTRRTRNGYCSDSFKSDLNEMVRELEEGPAEELAELRSSCSVGRGNTLSRRPCVSTLG